MRFGFACAAAVVAVLALPQAARADDAPGIEIAVKGGFKTNPFDNGADPVNPGLGARAGVSVSRFYFGVGLMYYVHADTQTAPPVGGMASGTGTLSSYDLMVGVEGGYDFPLLDVITLRPQVGVGAWTISSSCQSGSGASCIGESVTNPYLEPGVTALLLLGGHLLLGADANGLVLPVDSGKQFFGAFSMHAQAGVRF